MRARAPSSAFWKQHTKDKNSRIVFVLFDTSTLYRSWSVYQIISCYIQISVRWRWAWYRRVYTALRIITNHRPFCWAMYSNVFLTFQIRPHYYIPFEFTNIHKLHFFFFYLYLKYSGDTIDNFHEKCILRNALARYQTTCCQSWYTH